MSLAIDVRGLNKSFGARRVVQDVDLALEAGRICGFLGPNGSGKTTTLRMLCGLLTADSGHGQALGFDILREAGEIKRRTGYMTQRFSLYEDLTIAENLRFAARAHELDRGRERVDQAIARLGLEGRRNQLAGTLSGGWKQRLALAAATLHEPRLLLLDEPLGALDALTRIEMQQLIEDLWQQRRFTALLVTHDVQEAVALADRVLLVEEGRITLDQRIDLPRPRSRGNPGFALIEEAILARVLQHPPLAPDGPLGDVSLHRTVGQVGWAV